MEAAKAQNWAVEPHEKSESEEKERDHCENQDVNGWKILK
jgi:hypothetical protein